MNSFRKFGQDWTILVTDGSKAGDTVTVTLRDGRTKQATLAQQLGVDRDGNPFFAVKAAEQKVANVGNLGAIMAMFDKAAKHLKSPAIVLSVPAINETIRISVGGPSAKVPGSLTIVSMTTYANGRRTWYGRIKQNGDFEQSSMATQAVVDQLVAFAKDPPGVAAAHGKLTARCCFCNIELGKGEDKRSVEVGYGPSCADHFGLPWGTKNGGTSKPAKKAKKSAMPAEARNNAAPNVAVCM